MTAGRRGGVTKGRGCSPVVRSPFSASIFLLSFLVTRSVVHVVIQLSYRRILKRIFLKIFQISTMISQFFHGKWIDIDIDHTSTKLSNCQERETKEKFISSKNRTAKKNRYSVGSSSLPPLVLVIDREKRKWKKNG